jgi:hypothetical protein
VQPVIGHLVGLVLEDAGSLFLQDVRIWFCCDMLPCARRKDASPSLLWKPNNKFWLVMQCWNCKHNVAKLHFSVLMESYQVGLMSVGIAYTVHYR